MALFSRRSKKRSRLEALLQDLEIPVFQVMTNKVLERLREPEVELDAVVEALTWDPGLVSQVLSTVNSAAYGAKAPITDVGHAVSYMGADALERVVTVVAVKGLLPGPSVAGFSPAEFWRDAATRASLARKLSDRLHPEHSAEVFTTGLLCNIAVPLLVHCRPGSYGRVWSAWKRERTRTLSDLEQSAFGWDHASVGGVLAQQWGLPECLAAGISGHHGAEVPPALRLVGCLEDTDGEWGLGALLSEAHSSYGLDPDWVRECLLSSREEAAELMQALG